MTLLPSQRAKAILPSTAAMSSAQITNGTTAMPITDTASSRHTGPASSITSRPVMKAENGVARSVAVAVRTGASNTVLSSRFSRKKTSATVQTHGKPGTIGRPHNSPWVSHGTMSRKVSSKADDPMPT